MNKSDQIKALIEKWHTLKHGDESDVHQDMELMNHVVDLAMSMIKSSNGKLDLEIALQLSYFMVTKIKPHFENDG